MDEIGNDEREFSRELIEVFEEVKEAVRRQEGAHRAGLMLGLQEMGAGPAGFVGGYYPVSSNVIVMNKTPLRRIRETNPSLLRPYSFHILLHEYIHSLGVLDEEATRRKTYEVSRKCFGENHPATQLSLDIHRFFPNLVYPFSGWEPKGEMSVELIKGFDKSSYQNYIT
ncbi:MAG: hypothetical protein NT157_05315 [Candidatus Micrarchaeota archaeon]|nr:hypothetical protein [Candidatus Micrarchaeota archaeon]